MATSHCRHCGKELEPNEIALTKKLINRGATEFFCFSCLSKEIGVPEKCFPDLILRFRKQGCTLFEPYKE